MGGLERQVADYQEREDEVQRLARESKQQVEDALSLKDQVGLTYTSIHSPFTDTLSYSLWQYLRRIQHIRLILSMPSIM